MSINKVFISGNLTRDPELRSTASGMEVVQFGMAVNDRRKNNQTGEWESFPNFVDLTWFGSRAAKCVQYMHKGDKVSVDGKLRYSSWEKDGQKRSKLEVIVEDIEFMTGNQQSQQTRQQQYQPQPQYQQRPQYQQNDFPQYQQNDLYDEDIPF